MLAAFSTTISRHLYRSVNRCKQFSIKMGDELRPLSNAEIEAICNKKQTDDTKNFNFQHVMIRVKDPKKSLDFYINVLGMRLLKKKDMPSGAYTLYFVGYEDTSDMPAVDGPEKEKWLWSRRSGLVELTHNWGTENDPEQSYHSGNTDPRGFGHIAITVPDVDKACERFEQLGVQFKKKPNEGHIMNLAFVLDPDGYWIEIIKDNLVVK